MSLRKILQEDFGSVNNESIKKIIKQLEERTNYDLQWEPKLSEIGYGASAITYGVKNTDKVLRFGNVTIRGSHNRPQMEKLVEKDFSNVVNYYFYKVMHNDEEETMEQPNDYEVSVMERLERLDNDTRYLFDMIQNDYPDGLYYFCKYVDPDYPDEVREALDRRNEELVKKITNNADKIHQLYSGIRQLESIGIRHEDLRTSNIMQDPETGEIKIIDVT